MLCVQLYNFTSYVQQKVKQSLYRPGKALKFHDVEALRLRQSVYECGKVVSLTNRPHLPPQEIFIPGTNFC